MATRGRRPKPTVLHELQGTFHPTRHGRDRAGEPEAPGDGPGAPPDFLTEAQLEAWEDAVRWAPAGVLKPIDADTLLVWVQARDQWRRAMAAQAILDSQQPRVPMLVASKGGLVESPYVAIIRRAASLMLRAAAELGFTPASRPRLASGDGPKPPASAGPWAQLRVLQGGKAAAPAHGFGGRK